MSDSAEITANTMKSADLRLLFLSVDFSSGGASQLVRFENKFQKVIGLPIQHQPAPIAH